MQRVFGSAAASIEGSIKQIWMGSVPEAETDLQKIDPVDNLILGLDVTPGKAAAMSEALLQLAGDASAFADFRWKRRSMRSAASSPARRRDCCNSALRSTVLRSS